MDTFATMKQRILPTSFFRREKVTQIAKELLGHKLVTVDDKGHKTSGIIVETEAYAGIADKAAHAYGGRKTLRTQPLYGPAGTSYVYLCYGIHHLFNIVTNQKGIPQCVLLRALAPLEGIDQMINRRGVAQASFKLTKGPGSLTKAMGIDGNFNNILLGTRQGIWVEKADILYADDQILSGPRIGVAYAAEDASLPYRFWIKDNPYVCKHPKIA